MNRRDSALRRYYRKIRSYLPCSGKIKKKILSEICTNVSRYLEEFPNAEYSQIEARFGTPQCIAAAYVDDMDTQELLQSMHIRRKIVVTITGFLLIVLLTWTSVVCYTAVKAAKNYPGTITVDIWEEPIPSEAE